MTDEQKKTLIRQRGSIKSKLTTFSNYVKSLEGHSLCDTDVFNLEERIRKADNLISEYDALQTSLDLLVEEDEIQGQYDERTSFENSFYSVMSVAKKIISKNNKDVELTSNSSEIPAISNQSNGVKFPVINLPTFDGSMDKWLEFRDTFESLIHTNNAIHNIQKYHYLRASLQGGAAQVIRSIDLSDSNYPVAWDTLCDRYNNNRLLVHIHTKALFNLEPIQRESSSKIRDLIDMISKHLRSLAQLKEPTDKWDTLIIFLISTKLDSITSREWEQYKISSKEVTEWKDLKQFLKGRADMLETLEAKNAVKNPSKINQNRDRASTNNISKGFHVSNFKCVYCKKEHQIYNCEDFINLSTNDRISFAKKTRLCMNCLKGGHFEKTCRFGPCRRCRRHHNTLLHIDTSAQSGQAQSNEDEAKVALSASTTVYENQVLLSTAYVEVLDEFQNAHSGRALLDCGSQSSFITTEFAEALQLSKTKANITISGLNQAASDVRYKCSVRIRSKHGAFSSDITCLVLPRITGCLPTFKLNKDILDIPKNIKLADPGFNKPGRIDILIGADLFWEVLCVGQIHLGPNKPILQKTRLGWIISGQVGNNNQPKNIKCHLSTNFDLQDQLSKFWEVEDFIATKPFSSEEMFCEKHFSDFTKRESNGRFVVSLPLKKSPSVLGESETQAKKRFWSLERKLQGDPNFKQNYIDFMREYQSMGHMTEIDDSNIIHSHNDGRAGVYFMPHHGVLRCDSLTTKLRVVFDASAATTSSISLNDIQMVGPTLQDDLLAIILRFRTHVYVVSSDVAKMYRQVLVNPKQRSLQRILWRESPSEPLKAYDLNTVTYGQASASYLAIKCLFELARECEVELPDIAHIIRHDFYVDDLLTGANSIEEASSICKDVTKVLKKGCFELRKWISNEPSILNNLPVIELSHNILDFGTDQNAKTLGLSWNCNHDHLMFRIDSITDSTAITKRTILSHISQIFDPLGLLAPCTIIAKITIQKLWLEKLTWDESLPASIHSSWLAFKRKLPALNSIKIPRLTICKDYIQLEMHGFADASEAAYGGCIFIRSVNAKGEVFVQLLCAKSKVAPIKTLSLPRLELCGALILARIASKVKSSLNVEFTRCTFWTDSTIVLGWINTSPHMLKTFVSNRVAELQNLVKDSEWRHVPSKENPADLLSRGVFPDQIGHQHLWWLGPKWLKEDESEWPKIESFSKVLPEMREKKTTSFLINTQDIFLFNKYSNLEKLKRVTAFIFRFKDNCLKKADRHKGPLSSIEIETAFLTLVRLSQIECFSQDYNNLMHGKAISSKSKILSLNPLIDEKGLMRVGGRLSNSNFKFDKKYPILLSPHHRITKMIFINEHLRLLHPGPQLLLASVREKFWPISGRNIAKKTVRDCVKCFRFSPKPITPIMGDLPSSRFISDSPFQITGLDYAGPFYIKDRKGRGAKISKCYVCLFVCFATKALHLELVSDLTTECFILALRRFAARRGKPSRLYSDNASNFIGANRELKDLGKYLTANRDDLIDSFAREGIDWRFIPPHSPHFGGLWEAGVKSTKHHLKRVMGRASLIFEEFYSLLVQIEGILNSRPLFPLSSDPNDFAPLTPAHFLVGKVLTALPDPEVTHIPENRLTRYQRIQALQQHFWKRWSKEYISELQQRIRWKANQHQLQEGSLVIIKDDNLPPIQWKLGRITQLHPGKDSVARVATVRTSTGLIRRAFNNICPLPLGESAGSQ